MTPEQIIAKLVAEKFDLEKKIKLQDEKIRYLEGLCDTDHDEFKRLAGYINCGGSHYHIVNCVLDKLKSLDKTDN